MMGSGPVVTLLALLVTACVWHDVVSGTVCQVEEDAVLASRYTSLPTCSSTHVTAALASNARCRLHTVVLSLPWPNSTLVQQMTPTHVTVQRCAGGCHGAGQACAALATRSKEVSVMVGRCGVSVGKCEKECAVVSVEEHTACGCGCQLDRGECEASGLHKFRDELCACECRDTEAKQRCLEQGRTWAEAACSCGCPGGGLCPAGWAWHAPSCSCTLISKLEAGKAMVTEGGARSASEEADAGLGWELVLITGLLSLLAVLLALVVMLAARLRLARARERRAGRVLLVPSTLSGHYTPGGADPCSDLAKVARQRPPPLSDSGSDKQQLADRTDQLTDSSLCSSEQEKELSGGSCDSLPRTRQAAAGSQPCLQSVGLSRHLAIRPGPEGGSLRLHRPPRHLQPYPGPGPLQPHPATGPGPFQPYPASGPGPLQPYPAPGPGPLQPYGGSPDRRSPLPPLPCPNTYYHTPVPPESPYNTVKIVYRNGERRMELNCQVEPRQQPEGGLNITENPQHAFQL